MAKKSKALTEKTKKEIRKLNQRLTAIYNNFGYFGEYATSLRNELSQYVPMTKAGAISTATKSYDATTIDDTMAMLRSEIRTATEIKAEAKTRLSGVYKQRAKKYNKPEEEVTEAAIVEQVNAGEIVRKVTNEVFEKFYEIWKNKDSSKIYDKALEQKLDEIFRVGTKHIWTDSQYAEAFEALKNFDLLAMEV